MRKKVSSIKFRYPSARLKGMNQIFEIIRSDQNWKPEVVSVETIKTLGISPKKESNLVFALKFLGVIDDESKPTVEFENLREDFSGTLERLVRDSYHKVLNTIPVSLIGQETLVNFFMQQGYAEDTAEYQAKLFAWLCRQAGIDLPNIEGSFSRSRHKKG